MRGACRAATLLAALCVPGRAVADPGRLDLRAAFLEDGRLGVRVEGPALPEGAFAIVQVSRLLATGRERREIGVANQSIPFGSPGVAEGIVEGAFAGVPGIYRVRARVECRGQFPAVVEALRSRGEPATGEAVLGGPGSPEYLRAVVRERARLVGALRDTARFLADLEEMEAAVAQDREAGLARWRAWRPGAVASLEAIIRHGRDARDRYYPVTYESFAERFIFGGIYQAEGRKLASAEDGSAYRATGTFHGRRSSALPVSMLAVHVAVFWTETERYQAAAWRMVAEESAREAAAQRTRADRARWTRERARWDGTMLAWDASDAREDAVGAPPRVARFAAVADALRSWWDAEEAVLFPPAPVPGEEPTPAPDPAPRREEALALLAALERELGA